MNKQVLAITTDFGDQFATAQLRAVVAGLNYTGDIIENHSVTPYSLTEAAFEIDVLSQYTPKGTAHVCVIDPGVGSDRLGIIIKTKNSWFVGPNNGILSIAAHREGIEKVWKITESFFGEGVSHTFHGRDVFVKTGVLLSQGKTPEEFLCEEIPSSRLNALIFQEGQILHIDDYGNIKIHYSSPLNVGSTLLLKIHGKEYTIPTVITFTDVPLGEPLTYKGSSSTLELAVHQESAENYFNLSVGDVITIQ